MSEDWDDDWELDPKGPVNCQGGQGSVRKVSRRSDGVAGALKQLHANPSPSRERRFRMRQEVDALRALEGQGTPRIYDSNVEEWENRDVPLYVVMEWIEGPTLEQHVESGPRPLDEALELVQRLLATIERCHAFLIHHRDLKPKNIILRDGQPTDPILVDFGMAWCQPEMNETRGFETGSGQELGNRFLRLPEYVANRHVKDPRSDLTMLVGLLFYTVVAEYPRTLVDANGKMPHEVATIPAKLGEDRRWPKLRGTFTIGFQQSLDSRIQSSEKFRQLIESLEPAPDDGDLLAKALRKVAEIKDAHFKETEQIGNVLAAASNLLRTEIEGLARQYDFVSYTWGNSQSVSIRTKPISPTVRPVGLRGGIKRPTLSDLQVSYEHDLNYVNGEYVASYRVEETAGELNFVNAKAKRVTYYRRPAADTQSLTNAVTAVAKEVFRRLVETYAENLADGQPTNPA